MRKLPSNWIEVTLADVVSRGQYGWTTKAANSGLIKYLRTTDITHKHINWKTVPYCSQTPIDIEKYEVQSGDILISRTGSVGVSILIENVPFRVVFASYLIRFVPSPEVNTRYLYHFLQSENYCNQIHQLSSGIAVPNINAKKLANVILPLAPLAEQKRIADKLDTLLARIEACRVRLERVGVILKRFRQAVLAAATSGELTEDWRENKDKTKKYRLVSLGETGSDFRYGSSTKSQPSGKVPVLRMGNILSGKLDWSDLVFSSNHDEIEKYKLSSGDVLFNRTNSPKLVGKSAVFKGEQPAIYAGYLIRIRCGSELLPDYLNYCLNSPAGEEWRWRVKSDSVSQSNINAKKLARFQFELPPIQEQREIVRRVESLFAFADRLQRHTQIALTKVEHLTPALLDKAFRGELVPQNPNDESASVLLERIRAERLRQPDKPKRTRGTKRSKMTKKSVKKAILEFPEDQFSFDELRHHLAGDYEKLKDIIFALLNESEPSITQLFDEASQSIHFVRSNK